MKKGILWMMTAIVACGLSVFTACTKEDNPGGSDADETLSIVTLNVDGLPAYIDASLIGMGVMPMNVEGPREKYTPVISQYLAEKNFDFIAVQEDFDFNDQLDSKLKDGYNMSDTWGGLSLWKDTSQGLINLCHLRMYWPLWKGEHSACIQTAVGCIGKRVLAAPALTVSAGEPDLAMLSDPRT